MRNADKTREQLLKENNQLRDQIAALAKSADEFEKIEKELISSQEKFRVFFEFAPDAFYLSTLQGTFLDGNIAAEKILGYKKEILIGSNFLKLKLLSAKDLPFAAKALAKSVRGKRTGPDEFLLNHKDGSKVPVEISTYPVKIKGKKVVLGIARDISERKQNEEALRKSEQRYRFLAMNTLDTIWTTDADFNLTYVNDAVFSFLGYTPEEFIGLNPASFTPPEGLKAIQNAAERLVAKYKKGEISQEKFELQQIRKDGRVIHVEIRANLLQDSKGKINGFQGRSVNITEQKLTEKELILAKNKAEESDRLKSAFLANMSHEIRTPMNGILGFAELLKEPELTGDDQQKYINIIESSGERMLKTINDLIEISKLEASQMYVSLSEVNVNKQLQDIYAFFQPEVDNKGLQLVYNDSTFEPKLTINTDNEKLYGILVNLIKNAIKYTNKGSIEFGYIGKDSFVEFFVKDTGIGIPKDRQEAIFDRFIQADLSKSRSFEGAGLGLSITKAYVEMLGGKIRVESEEGKGSVFYFTIPYTTNPPLQ